MAKKKLDIFLGMDNAELKSKLNESTNLLKGFQTTIGGVLGGAALGISIKSMGDFAINASKKFEQAQISFSKMLQSEKDGQKLINDIQNLANATPMTSDSLANNARLLLNFNAVARDEVIPTLKMLGDITGGDQARMDSLTLAFAQSASAGRLMGQDLLQMINAGFNPLQIMAEKTGKSIAQLKDEMSKGKITTEMVVQAFKDATEAGGKFYGMMEAQSQSKAGLEATKADSLEILARTIMDSAMPALKELDKAEIDLIRDTTEVVKTIGEWTEVNNQTINGITNMALALTTAVLGYKGLTAIVQTVSTVHLQAVAALEAEREAKIAVTQANYVVTAAEEAYQTALTTGNAKLIERTQCEYYAATATLKQAEAAVVAKTATVGQLVATGNLTQAFKVATVQVRAFTASLWANPFTWIAVAIGGLTYAVFNYKNSLEEAGKAMDDINAKYDQQNRAIDDNISTINRLVDVKKRSVTQEEELNKAIDALIKQYPGILSEYDKEIIKLQGVNKELARKIYLTTQAAKVEDLQRQKEKIDKKAESQRRGYVLSQTANSARTGMPLNIQGGRYGVRKSVQRDQDRINKELEDAQKLLKQIENNEVSYGTNEEKKESRPITSGASTATSKKSNAKNAADSARKEAIALKQAELDAQILQVRKNSEEEYALELQKINAKIALEKQGTAAYQQAVNERTKLEQQHQQQIGEMELAAFNNKMRLTELDQEYNKKLLEKDRDNNKISNDTYYNTLLGFEEQKYNLKLEYLNKQQEIYKNDLQKFTEIEQQKAILAAEYNNTILDIQNERTKEEYAEVKDFVKGVGETFKSSLGDFISGNKTLKDSYKDLFKSIYNDFANMIVKMMAKEAMLSLYDKDKGTGLLATLGGKSGWVGTAANFIKGFFADGGIVPGNYSQAQPVIAHGSEMVLNPLQQKNLWNLIASGNNAQANNQNTGSTNNQQPVIVNNITPMFQSLDPAQGQKMFSDWMKQSGIPLVRDSIKNNNHQMRDTVRGV